MNPPYYIVPIVEEYRKLDPESEEAGRLGRLIVANVGDYASLRLILGIDPPEFARFYPDMETTTPSTLDTIDSFLDKFGKLPDQSLMGRNMEEYNLEDLEAESTSPNDYIPEEAGAEEPPLDFSSLMKGKHYEEALKFIESQNLNNPDKSVYFAHQIRFLRKLIAINKYRNQTKG